MRGYYERGYDRYAFQQDRQNRGLCCSDCLALAGHYSVCLCIRANEDTMLEEAKKAKPYLDIVPMFSETDKIHLRGMGVKS
jgi:hypothetical protein